MKLCYFDDYRLGVIKGDTVVDITDAMKDIPHLHNRDLIIGLIDKWDSYKAKVEKAAADGKGVPLKGVRLRPPVPKPGNIVCMAVNYMEDGTLKEKPQINAFHKAATAVIGDGDTMVLPDVPAGIFEGEAELALIIGKRATRVPQADAMKYIFGYTCFIDGSARGLPPPGNVFFQMKSRDTFAPMGPWLVTADEIPDPNALDLELTVNGEVRQKANTAQLIYDVQALIEYASSFYTLYPGDLIFTGTPEGVSQVMPGDVIGAGVQGIGVMQVKVAGQWFSDAHARDGGVTEKTPDRARAY